MKKIAFTALAILSFAVGAASLCASAQAYVYPQQANTNEGSNN